MRALPVALAALALLLGALVAPAPPAAAADASVAVSNYAFTPASVHIDVGQSVTWTWQSGYHSVAFSSSSAPAACPAQSGGACTRTFATAGVFGYVCGIHSGMTGSVTVTAPQPPPPANVAPLAWFELVADGMTVSANASGSSDNDGSIASYAWNWGDGETGTGRLATHTYLREGTYTVALTVTDDDGAATSTTRSVSVSPPNALPVADFSVILDRLHVSVDAAAAYDPDGQVVAWTWDWGDGSAASEGVSASHTYSSPGSYNLTLRVRDDRGAIGTSTRALTLVTHDAPPSPFYSWVVDNLTLHVDATASSDEEGEIRTWRWEWGDGNVTEGSPTASHTYAARGRYEVTLLVEDDVGQPEALAHEIDVGPPNVPPVATFTAAVQGPLAVAVDASASSDADGRIVSYLWEWGDGETGSGEVAGHVYAAAGAYTIRLIVTDDGGAAGGARSDVRVNATGDRARPTQPSGGPVVTPTDDVAPTGPRARLEVDVLDGMRVRADAAGSVGAARFAWDWGDGSPPGEGVAAEHTYAAEGMYVVRLTVTDEAGRTAVATREVAVGTAAPMGGEDDPATGAHEKAMPAPGVALAVGLLALVARFARRRDA